MAKLLLEDTWSFQPDRQKIRIVESQGGMLKAHVVPGIISKCDEINGNNRRYPRAVWEANTKEDSKLQTLIKRRAAFGLLEHPTDGTISLQSPISHAVTKIELREDGTVAGEITILDGEGFPDGKKLRGLIEFGYDPLVSTRGYGSVVRTTEGVDDVQTDYVCEGADIVMTPSFISAQLTPSRESAVPQPRPASTKAVIENQGPTVTGKSLNKPTVKIMDLHEIRTAAGSLRSVDILTASPRIVAESFTHATILHRQLSEFQAANPGSAWDCTQLHEELTAIESKWTTSIQAIREENTRLKSDRDKLVLVADNMTKIARLYRTQLVETVQKRNATVKLYEAVCARGRGWQSIAVKRGAKVQELEHQVQVACRGIDMLAEQLVATENGDNREAPLSKAIDELAEMYHVDTTKLSRRIAELKHPVDCAKPEIKERLEKCKTAEEVLGILNELDKAAGATPEKPIQESKPAAPAAVAPVTIPAPAAVPAAAAKPIQESAASTPTSPATEAAPKAEPVIEGITAVPSEAIGHELSMEQAIQVVRRGSPSARITKVEPTTK
jgi:hypothetical protein